MDYVHHLEAVISSLHLTTEELAIFNPFYDYETMIYTGYNIIRDQMSVFDRQIESIPYHDLPATQLENLAGLIDEVLSHSKEKMAAIREFVEGGDYQSTMKILSGAKMDFQTWIVELIDLVGLYKIESHNEEAIKHLEELKSHILGEISSFGADMLEVVEKFKNSDASIKCYKLYDEIVNMQKYFPTKIDFSFIRV